MLRNKETADHGKLDVQLTSCMYEIKHDGTKRETDYNISKFVQILVGNEYISKHRKEHRMEEWKAFRRPYVRRVLWVYADNDERKLLLDINGFSEEYCKLGVGARYKKIADEIGVTTKTVRNREDKIIEPVVKKLLNEIQENDRHNLKLFADEVFAELDSVKLDDEVDGYGPETYTDYEPVSVLPPDSSKSAKESSDEQGKVFSDQNQRIRRLQCELNIAVATLVIVIIIGAAGYCLQNYFNSRAPKPLIERLLVTTPEICLYPKGKASIQLYIEPDEADIDSVSCIPKDSKVATVNHRIVTAQPEWQEENHETTIEVQGGVALSDYVHVTVLPYQKEQFTGTPDGKNMEKEGEQ